MIQLTRNHNYIKHQVYRYAMETIKSTWHNYSHLKNMYVHTYMYIHSSIQKHLWYHSSCTATTGKTWNERLLGSYTETWMTPSFGGKTSDPQSKHGPNRPSGPSPSFGTESSLASPLSPRYWTPSSSASPQKGPLSSAAGYRDRLYRRPSRTSSPRGPQPSAPRVSPCSRCH